MQCFRGFGCNCFMNMKFLRFFGKKVIWISFMIIWLRGRYDIKMIEKYMDYFFLWFFFQQGFRIFYGTCGIKFKGKIGKNGGGGVVMVFRSMNLVKWVLKI